MPHKFVSKGGKMKKLFLSLSVLVMLTSCTSQSKVATGFQSFKGRFFATPEEKQLDKVVAAIREGNTEKAEVEIFQINSAFTRSQALGKLIHFHIEEQGDLISAKKAIEKLEQTIQLISSKEDKLYSQVEYADFMHHIDKESAMKMLKDIEAETWTVIDPNERSRILIRIVSLQLETQKNAHKAKETIEQTRQTIDFIQKPAQKRQRTSELENILLINNHILCKTI